MEQQDGRVCNGLIFIKLLKPVFPNGFTNLHPPLQCRRDPVRSTTSPAIDTVRQLTFCQLETEFHCGLDMHFPDQWCQQHLLWLLAKLVFSFMKMPSCLLLINYWVICNLHNDQNSSHHSLLTKCVTSIFSHLAPCFSIILLCVCVFNLNEVKFAILFIVNTLGILRKSSYPQGQRHIQLYFPINFLKIWLVMFHYLSTSMWIAVYCLR